MARLVSCTKKLDASEPHFRVAEIGGILVDGKKWTCPIDKAIEEIESGHQTYYINVNGFTPNLEVASVKGRKYIKAPFDTDIPATLLGLPDC